MRFVEAIMSLDYMYPRDIITSTKRTFIMPWGPPTVFQVYCKRHIWVTMIAIKVRIAIIRKEDFATTSCFHVCTASVIVGVSRSHAQGTGTLQQRAPGARHRSLRCRRCVVRTRCDRVAALLSGQGLNTHLLINTNGPTI